MSAKQLQSVARQRASEDREALSSWHRIAAQSASSPIHADLASARLRALRQGEVIRAGDFVETRRSRQGELGIVLARPRDAALDANSGAGAVLYCLNTAGVVYIARATDVMLHIPALVPRATAARATPHTKRYVGDATSSDLALISQAAGVLQQESGNAEPGSTAQSTGQVQAPVTIDHSSVRGTNDPESQEPFDEDRFQARATVCRTLRILKMAVQQEVSRFAPHFNLLYLSRQQHAAAGAQPHSSASTSEASHITAMEVATTILARLRKEQSQPHSKHGAVDPSTVTRAQYLAAHLLLMDNPSFFTADTAAHKDTQLFTRRGDAELDTLARVSRWARALPSEPGSRILDSFAEQVRRVRAWRARHADQLALHDGSAPRRVEITADAELALGDEEKLSWTPDHLEIIRFLRAAVGNRREIQDHVHGPVAMEILKRCDAHSLVSGLPPVGIGIEGVQPRTPTWLDGATVDLPHALVTLFLQEIGALAPWANPNLLDAGVQALIGDELGELHGAKPAPAPASDALDLRDRDESLREERGETVFIIDDENAHELDDGIALQRIPGSDDVWVHIHVADPSAFLEPGDAIAARAARRQGTIYFPEAVWPMLPSAFVNAGIGLGTAKGGVPERAFTLSAKMTPQGRLLDYKVSLSHLKRVKVTSYNAVNALLGGEELGEKWTAQEKEDLTTLRDLARRLADARAALGAIGEHWSRGIRGIGLSPLPLPAANLDDKHISLFAGFPSLQIFTPLTDAAESTPLPGKPAMRSTDMVAEYMILGGRIGALFASAHDLPMLYRTQKAPEAEDIARMLATPRLPSGFISPAAIVSEQIALPGAAASDRPEGHFSMGIRGVDSSTAAEGSADLLGRSGYLRATSPLRRYPDLICHWQMRAVLRGDRAPWDRAAMEAERPMIDRMAKWTRSVSRNAAAFWHLTKIEHILNGTLSSSGTAQLTAEDEALSRYIRAPLDAVVTLGNVRFRDGSLKAIIRVELETLRLPAELEWPRGPGERPFPAVGTRVKVRVVEVVKAGLRVGVVCVLA